MKNWFKETMPWPIQKAARRAIYMPQILARSWNAPHDKLPYITANIKKIQGNFPRRCPICGYEGYFDAFGFPPRYDAKCSKCGSLERHRLLYLRFIQNGEITKNTSVLHFAPEPIIFEILKSQISQYQTADISGHNVDLCLNIEEINFPSNSLDAILCNHVLEHVDDAKALSELNRVLKPGGTLYAMVPIIEGWEKSYENNSVNTPEERELHFGQHDHVRYYGHDIRSRIEKAGFELEEATSRGDECVEFSLLRGEKVFVCKKSEPGGTG